MSIVDLKEIHNSYTRLSEKFKTYWTFHQFLSGIHKTFFGNAPGYQIDFQGLYDEIKQVTVAMTFQPPAQVIDTINKLDLKLDQIHSRLFDDDRKISPNYVRRFFERIRTEDEKLLLSILRFYFYSKVISKDTLDKMDFLITLVGARKSLDDGHFLPRFPVELQKLFGGFLSLARRQAVDVEAAQEHVRAFDEMRHQIESCTRFEDLTERRLLENLRARKHALGMCFYNADVLSAMLEANLAAKNKFQSLYLQEERRIEDSSRKLLEIERELERNPRLADNPELREDLRLFHQYREGLEKEKTEGGVRHQDVTRLTESIDQLMQRFESVSDSSWGDPRAGLGARSADPGAASAALRPDGPGDGTSGAGAPAAARLAPTAESRQDTPASVPAPGRTLTMPSQPRPEIPRSRSVDDTSPVQASELGAARRPGASPARIQTPTAVPGPGPSAARSKHSDPLTSDQASRILFSVEMLDEGTGSGGAAYSKELKRLRLEPCEVRASRRIINDELPADPTARSRDLLFFDAAALRMRIDEEAHAIRAAESVTDAKLGEIGSCLVRAQELDRRFRQAIEMDAQASAPPERLNELTRSRFRLLRSFSGLWLLHNARVV